MIHIAQDGSGDFTTITAALSSLSTLHEKETIFYIHNGIYHEQVCITRPNLTLLGESIEGTILTHGLYARMRMPDGTKRGTFRSYSCLIDTHDFTAKNLTFENSAGDGTLVGQAIAAYVDGDRIIFDNCRFLGNQDTLFTGPLPPTEIEPNGFLGPKQHSPRINGRHYYKNCYMEGTIDFIFGSATAFFEACEFYSKDMGQPVNSFVSAASTPVGQRYGYVMKDCRFTGNCPPQSAYLGRPWREYAKTVLINCYMDAHICQEGWHDWGKENAHETALYAEYGSTGPGADNNKRPAWILHLTLEQLEEYTKELVLGGTDHWNPQG